jgi:hypothetical protein
MSVLLGVNRFGDGQQDNSIFDCFEASLRSRDDDVVADGAVTAAVDV